jgi:hypothetical protein
MTNFKNLSIYILLIAVGIALVAFIVPALIKGFFIGLLWMMNNPLLGLIISSAFLAGCFLGNFETKSNKSV